VINGYSRLLEKTKAKRIPFSALLELTYKCNLKCRHCYVVDEPQRQELSFEKICSILDELARAGCLYLVFTGGEILTRSDFFDIAFYAGKKGFALRLFTNGTLITPKAADKIKQICPASVEMSLYAKKAPLHDAVTGVKGSYEKTTRVFKLLKERGINTVMKSVLMKDTLGEFEGLKDFAAELGCRFVYDVSIVPRNDGCKKPQSCAVGQRELKKFLLRQVKIPEQGPLPIPLDSALCNAGVNTVSVSAYGEVFACMAIRKPCGDLNKELFSDIWYKSPALSEIRSARFSDLSQCRQCRFLNYCDRCSGVAFLEAGDFLGASKSACQKAAALKECVEELQGVC